LADQAHGLVLARPGIELIQLAAQAMDIDPHRGIGIAFTSRAGEDGLGDLDFLGCASGLGAGEQKAQQLLHHMRSPQPLGSEHQSDLAVETVMGGRDGAGSIVMSVPGLAGRIPGFPAL
jgi:hypothetical protein